MAQTFHVPAKGPMENFEKHDMSTLVSCSNHLLKEGFTENFRPKHAGLEATSNGKIYVPSEVKIVSFYRFEGESDPADNSILYAIEANDGTKGLLVDAYGGPYVNQKVGKFIKEVEEIAKRAHTDVGPHCQTKDCEDVEKRIQDNKDNQPGSPEQNP
jgi:hypothetical protein